NDDVVQSVLSWNLVAESDPIVERACHDVELSRAAAGFLNAPSHLVVVIAYFRDFAPWLRPRFVEARPGRVHDAKTAAQRGCATEGKAQARRQEQVLSVALESPEQSSILHDDVHHIASIR